jgi:uncharacterized paraquat-inducible protein A
VRRRLFNFATALSLLLCMATVVLWVRSYRSQYDYRWVMGYGFVSLNGGYIVDYIEPSNIWRGVTLVASGRYSVLVTWLSATPIMWAINFYYRSRRQNTANGHCRTCSYSLTGNTRGVCPECGMAVERSFS